MQDGDEVMAIDGWGKAFDDAAIQARLGKIRVGSACSIHFGRMPPVSIFTAAAKAAIVQWNLAAANAALGDPAMGARAFVTEGGIGIFTPFHIITAMPFVAAEGRLIDTAEDGHAIISHI